MLNLTQIIELKKLLSDSGAVLHTHDTCGGQYFTLEKTDEKCINIIEGFLRQKGQSWSFSSDGKSFTVK